ncbi:uncharacterized protein DS421_9g259440 [Arachis hypogaea]|nr:uncharacterized protein DS421_9g259440 [Arachis hypogaea]
MEATMRTCIKDGTTKGGRSLKLMDNPLGNNPHQLTMSKSHSKMHINLIPMVDPLCSYQQSPPYAYEPPPQHSFEPPYSQATYNQTLPYDPKPYPPYQPPYEPDEPYIEPPQFQSNYSQEPPPQHTPPPMYANFQPQYDPNYVSQAKQEPLDQFKEAMDRIQATIHQMELEEGRKAQQTLMANIAKTRTTIDPWDSCNKQSISTDECVVQQVKKMESVELPLPYHDESPSYHEPFLPSNEPSYPVQSPMDDTLGVLLQGQREIQRMTLEFIATLTEVVDNLASVHFDTQSTWCGNYNPD